MVVGNPSPDSMISPGSGFTWTLLRRSSLMLALLLIFLGSLCRKPEYKPEIVNISSDACLSERPCIARSGDGRLAIGWTGAKTGYEDIWLVEKAQGGNWSAPENISNAGRANGSRSVSIEYDALGTLHAAWSQYMAVGLGSWVIIYSQKPRDGIWATAETIRQGTAVLPHIAVDTAGIVHLAFEDMVGGRSTVHYTTRHPAAGWGQTEVLSDPCSAVDCDLAVLADGTSIAVWENWSIIPAEVFRTERRSSGEWTQPVSAHSYPGYGLNPQLATDGRRVALAFGVALAKPVIAVMTRDVATGWSDPDTSCAVHIPGSPSVAYDSLGRVFLAWGNEPELRVARRDGSWSQTVVSDSLMPSGTSIVADEHGRAHVAWRSQPVFEDPGEIYYSEVAIAPVGR